MGGPQALHVGNPACARFGVLTHEIGHALGLWHEHQRDDRFPLHSSLTQLRLGTGTGNSSRDFISIRRENVMPSKRENFLRCDVEGSCFRNTPYDYGSVMHYDTFVPASLPPLSFPAQVEGEGTGRPLL